MRALPQLWQRLRENPSRIHAQMIDHAGGKAGREPFGPEDEIAADRNVCIKLEEALVPLDEVVQGACEILGLDSLYVANEGRFAVFVPAVQTDAALAVMNAIPVSQGSVRVGHVEESPGRTVILQSRIGDNRMVDMLSGEQLPRIC